MTAVFNTIIFPYSQILGKRHLDNFTNKTIIITGGTSGIGAAIVDFLSGIPCQLFVVGRNEQKLSTLSNKKVRAQIYPFKADLRRDDQLQAFHNFILSNCNKVDFLINNAGISLLRNLIDSTDRLDDVERTININYKAPVFLTLKLIPLLKKNKGSIINISALNIKFPYTPYWAAYQASKIALDQWMKSNRHELNAMNIQLKSVYLPLVRTEMISPTKKYDNAPALTAHQAAVIILKLAQSKKQNWLPYWGNAVIFIIYLMKPFLALYYKFSTKKNL